MTVIDLLLIVGGLFLLVVTAVKPNFFWQSKGIQRRRQLIGDRKTTLMYVVTAVVMLAVGLWGALGGL